MLTWNEVRILLAQHVAPSVSELGFGQPGKTMRRYRNDFVDIIDFRCGKWNDRFIISFGCGVRKYIKNNPKPWDCAFYIQPSNAWPNRLLKFQETTGDQILAFKDLNLLLINEAEKWFDHFSSPKKALESARKNKPDRDNHVGLYKIPSPAYDELETQIKSIIKLD